MDKAYNPPQNERAHLAWEIVVDFLRARGMLNSGGAERVFWSPEEWRARGERYGTRPPCVLVVTHDGGAHARAFSWEYEDYETIEALSERLRSRSFLLEQCTGWYSGIYDEQKEE